MMPVVNRCDKCNIFYKGSDAFSGICPDCEKKKEKKYPIYFIHADWTQNNLDYRNATSMYRMLKDGDPGIHAMNQQGMNWIETVLENPKYDGTEPDDIRLLVEFREEETWCITCFSHYSFNTHLSDADLIESFEDFVERKRRVSNEFSGERKYCLMGAEERHRWKGPCRCMHCVNFGVTRIDH